MGDYEELSEAVDKLAPQSLEAHLVRMERPDNDDNPVNDVVSELVCGQYLTGRLTREELDTTKKRFESAAGARLDRVYGTEQAGDFTGRFVDKLFVPSSITNSDITQYGDTHGLQVPSPVRADAHRELSAYYKESGILEKHPAFWVDLSRRAGADFRAGKINEPDYQKLREDINATVPFDGMQLTEKGKVKMTIPARIEGVSTSLKNVRR